MCINVKVNSGSVGRQILQRECIKINEFEMLMHSVDLNVLTSVIYIYDWLEKTMQSTRLFVSAKTLPQLHEENYILMENLSLYFLTAQCRISLKCKVPF